ncbi:extracellular solute-binding protein [Paenibacillus sp. GYB003]|uniref:extracellular solute-binding protein n=1 Tax=Paenibacillus sp. GYB003 TaxID=2994392 RepID=UPI002F966140
MWKKTFAVALTAAVAAGTVAACGSGGDEQKAAQGGDAGGAKGNVTVRFHAQNVTFDKTMMAPVIAKFEEKHPGIKIDFVGMTEPTSDEVTKKIDLLAASGEPLDVFLLADARSYSQRAANGMLEPLDKYIEKEGFKFADEYKTDTKWNGSYYALPGTFNQWFVIMNKNHLDEAGLKVPTVDWTWDDYLDYAKKLTKGEGASKRYGTYYHSWADYFLLGMWNQPGKNDIVWTDKTVNMDHPGVRKSLDIRQRSEMIDKSAIPYADSISQKLTYRPLYFNQNISMMAIGSWMIGEVGGTDQFPATFKTVFAPIPRNEKSDPTGHAMSSSNYLAIASTSKHKEEAYKFMRFFSTEGLAMMQKYTTSWKKEDTGKLLDAIIGATKTPQNVDKESLLYVLNNTKPVTLPPALPYQAEVYKAYQEEVEKMLLGQQDIDKTIAAAKDKLQKLVNANK